MICITTTNVGDTLRALIYDEEGNEVNPEDVDAEIQWFADGKEITAETDAEYTVLVGDVGVVLSVEVTIGDETYTAETEKVEAAEVEELTVKIDNTTPKVGDTLKAEVVDRNGEDVSDNVKFQWYADDAAIEGADEDTLVVDDELLGAALKVVVTAESGNTFESEPTAEVEAAVEELTVTIVSEDEIPTVGELLTAVVTDEDGEVVDAELLHYQWYAGEDAIDESDTAILLVTDEFVGKTLSVEVTDADGNTFKSEPTAEVEAAAVEDEYVVLLNNTAPTVGDEIESELVDAEDHTEIIDAEGFEIQWYADGEAIEGADEATLVVDEELVGKVLKVVYTDAEGNEYESEETEAVEAAAYTVEISNSTPTVGDTLTFTLYDAEGNEVNTDDIDAEIQWFLGETEIEGETDAELEVTGDMVGSVISVIVTIDDEEYTDATEEVKDEDDGTLAIERAEQTGANEATVIFNRELEDGETIKVTRGTSEIAVSAIENLDEIYVLTFASTLVDDTYTVVVSDEDDNKTEGYFDAEVRELASINWLSDTLDVESNTAAGMTKVSTYVKGEDQWGDEMPITGATWTASTGTPSYNAQTGKLTLTNAQAYTIGTTVTVICVVQDKAIAENHNYTVGMANSIASLELGEMTSDNPDYKDLDEVTEKALENGAYYIPVTAMDKSGVELTEADLTAMLNQTLFVTPDANANTGVLYFNGFATKNGKPVMKIAAGTTTKPVAGNTDFNLVADMPAVLSVLSTGDAGSVTKNITIYRSPVITDMIITLPSDLYAGKKSEFTVTATDQNGNDINLYDYAIAGAQLRFADGTALTTTGGAVKVTVDKTKKAVKFEITPTAGAAGMVSITGTTKGLGSVIVNAQYQADRTIDSISSLNKNLKTTLMSTAPGQQMNHPVLAWNDGVALSDSEIAAAVALAAGTAGKVQALKGPLTTGTLTATGGNITGGYAVDASTGHAAVGNVAIADAGLANSMNNVVTYAYAYTLSDADYLKFCTNATGTAVAGNTAANALFLTPVAEGTAVLTTHLYKLTTTLDGTGAGTVKVDEINTLKTDVTVQKEAVGKYVLKTKEDKLYVGDGDNQFDTVGLELSTESGAAVKQALITNMRFVIEDDTCPAVLALDTSDATKPYIKYTTAATTATWGAGKTSTVTAYATLSVAGETEQVSCEFEITNEKPKADKIVWYKPAATNDTEAPETYAAHVAAGDSTSSAREYSIPLGDIAKALHGVFVIDQYGNDITKDVDSYAQVAPRIVNVKARADGTAPNPTVAWGSTNTSLVKITDGATALAVGDVFDIVVEDGSQSTTFRITITA